VQWQQVQATLGNLKGLEQQAVVMGACCLLSCRLAAWRLGLLLGVALKDAVGMLQSCKRLHVIQSLSKRFFLLVYGVCSAALLNHRFCHCWLRAANPYFWFFPNNLWSDEQQTLVLEPTRVQWLVARSAPLKLSLHYTTSIHQWQHKCVSTVLCTGIQAWLIRKCALKPSVFLLGTGMTTEHAWMHTVFLRLCRVWGLTSSAMAKLHLSGCTSMDSSRMRLRMSPGACPRSPNPACNPNASAAAFSSLKEKKRKYYAFQRS